MDKEDLESKNIFHSQNKKDNSNLIEKCNTISLTDNLLDLNKDSIQFMSGRQLRSAYIQGNMESAKQSKNLMKSAPIEKCKRPLTLNEKRGETPGSDCPVFINPPVIVTQNEPVEESPGDINFSSGGDEEALISGSINEYIISGSDSDSFIWASGNAADLHSSQRRMVDGADSCVEVIPSLLLDEPDEQTSLDTPQVSMMHRNSPAGISTPESIANVTSLNRSDLVRSKIIRPPVLGQSEDIKLPVSNRKDLGSTDGEESSSEGKFGKNKINPTNKIRVKPSFDKSDECPLKNSRTKKRQSFSKPDFIVGGITSPRDNSNVIRNRLLNVRASLNLTHSEKVINVNDPETSLNSIVSIESTHPAESSDRVTSPSVLSVSSIASSKKLDWDSAGDVGYVDKDCDKLTSLSTLERIAIGNYASMLRTDPEGTPQITKAKVNRKDLRISRHPKSKISSQFSKDDHQFREHDRSKSRYTSSEDDFDHSSILSSPRRKPRKRMQVVDNEQKDNSRQSSKSLNLSKNKICEKATSLTELRQSDLRLNKHSFSTCSQLDLFSSTRKKTSGVIRESHSLNSNIALNSSNSLYPTEINLSTSETLVANLTGKGSSITSNEKSFSSGQCSDQSSVQVAENKLTKIPSSISCIDMPKPISLASVSEQQIIPTCNCDSSRFTLEDDICNEENLSEIAVSDKYGYEPLDIKLNISDMKLDSPNNISLLDVEEINATFKALSVKLQSRVHQLMNLGSIAKVDDYQKLLDYIDFVGSPSENDDEIKLKQNVADIILRMFGEMNISKSDSSQSGTKNDKSCSLNENISTHSSHFSKSFESYTPEHEVIGKFDSTPSIDDFKHDTFLPQENSTNNNDDYIDRCITPGGSITCIPYRPSSATRTYYVGVPEGFHSSNDICEELGNASSKRKGRKNDQEKVSTSGSPTDALSDTPIKSSNNDSYDKLTLNRNVDSANVNLSEYRKGNDNINKAKFKDKLKEFQFQCENADEEAPLSRNKGVYQDRHGILHIAHQPPGYNDEADSHQSESTSDNDVQHNQDEEEHQQIGIAQGGDIGLQQNHPMLTSTGSESAYETIREKDRNIAEALASSFEFYSTSPRDARVLGYVSSDHLENIGAESSEKISYSSSTPSPRLPGVAISNDSQSPYKSCKNLGDSCKFNQTSTSTNAHSTTGDFERDGYCQGKRNDNLTSSITAGLSTTESDYRQRSNHKKYKSPRSRKLRGREVSMRNDTDEGSSSISIIQIQKQKYIRRIQHYINSLEKLEKTLAPKKIDDSVKQNRRRVTEGCSDSDFHQMQSSRRIINRSVKTSRKKIGLAVDDTGCSGLISSESNLNSIKSSESSVCQSFVIHQTIPDRKEMRKFDRWRDKNQCDVPDMPVDLIGSTNTSPRHTSTLRREDSKGKNNMEKKTLDKGAKSKNIKKHSVADKKYGNVENAFREFDHGGADLQKLIYSKKVPGEVRPHRYLINRPSFQNYGFASEEKISSCNGESKINQNNQIHQNSEINSNADTSENNVTDHLRQGDCSKSSKESDFLENYDFKKRENNCQKYFNALPNSCENSNILEEDSLRNDDIPVQRNNREEWKSISESTRRSKNVQTSSTSNEFVQNLLKKAKVMKEFGQVYPSVENISVETDDLILSNSRAIQTGQSLLNMVEAQREEMKNLNSIDKEDQCFIDSDFINDRHPPNLKSAQNEALSLRNTQNEALSSKSTQNEFEVRNLYGCNTLNHEQPSSIERMHKRIEENAARLSKELATYYDEYKPVSKFYPPICETRSMVRQPPAKDVPIVVSTKERIQFTDVENEDLTDEECNDEVNEKNRDVESFYDKLLSDQTTVVKETGMQFVLNFENSDKNQHVKHTVRKDLIEMNKENKNGISLQEALAYARPSYFRKAEHRRQKIIQKRIIRLENQEQNHNVLAELPDNLKTPNTLKRFIVKPAFSPLMSYQSMREQNRRLIEKLPETKYPKIVKRRRGTASTNRLMATLYSQKLQRKAVVGKVSHGHQEVVTPIK